MESSFLGVRGERALFSALSQVFLFMEHVNASARIEAKRFLEHRIWGQEGAQEGPRGEALMRAFAHFGPDFKNIILQLLKWLVSGGRWSRRSMLLRLLQDMGLQPEVNRGVLESLVDLLFRPARIVPVDGEVAWRIEGSVTSLPRPAGIDVLFERLWLSESERGPLLATRPLPGRECQQIPELPVYYWEEPFDPVGIARLYISEVLGEGGRAADHYLQRWLRSTFSWSHYDKHHKYVLAKVCESLNQLFYDAAVPPTQLVHNHRTATVSVALLIREIEAVLRNGHRESKKSLSAELDRRCLRQSVGLYLFLHFCRQVRRRTFWLDLKGAGARRLGLAPEMFRRLESVNGEQCVSSLSPLGYTYFQARIFGAISSIPGLSNIFRGGILPRTDSGQSLALLGPAGIGKTVLALQMMTDVARFGGLSVYISFEESYDSILDRLVTFGLWDGKFKLLQAGEDLVEAIQDSLSRDPEKGLLIFYQPSKAAGATLPHVIFRLGEDSSRWVGPKALVVDNVNSLHFASVGQSDAMVEESRAYLYESIYQIERGKFLGVLLGEKDGRYYRTLPYLVETVIELGFDESAHTRWVEVKKCRAQHYHEGKHPFRMLDGRGAIIYPSLASRRSSLRGRVRSTLSQRWVIPYPGAPGLEGIAEKSSTLIWGPPGSGKTLVALKLLAAASILKGEQGEALELSKQVCLIPQNVMVVSFRTSEKNFMQALERQPDVAANWGRIPQRWLRWYSPGSNLTAEQIVSEIWRYFKDSRRRGVPVNRIMFDETEVAQDVLPALRRDQLFWPTILELTSTEAATSFFICGARTEESSVMRALQGNMDNAVHVYEKVERGERLRCVDLVQHTELGPGEKNIVIENVSRAAEDVCAARQGAAERQAGGFAKEMSGL